MGNFGYTLKTAYRDSRRNRPKLLMFVSSIILGITALVAINSFNYNLVKDIDEQSKSLLGADFVINGNKPLDPTLQSIADSIPGERATELELFSMSFIPKTEETQFVRIKAIDGAFPFYGEINTQPKLEHTDYQSQAAALVDDGLMLEHNLNVGDSIKLGEFSFIIAARLMNTFGNVSLGSSFAPSIYIGQKFLYETNLIQPGSMVDYSYYYKVPQGYDMEEWESNPERRKKFRDESFRMTTIKDQRENLDEAFSNLNSFLNLIALVSLILGCIGVASSVFIYIKSKIPSIAILRCIGMKGRQAFQVFFIQIFIIGLLAVIVGITLGSLIQLVLPEILADILPYEVNLSISWRAIMEGLVIGVVMTSLFAMVPLLSIRRISPLRTLRASINEDSAAKDIWVYIVNGAILIFLFFFLWNLTKDVMAAAVFTIGLIIAFLMLYGVSSLIMIVIKKYFPKSWSFVFRQGLSNLFRPNNQTRTLIVSIGLGTSILTLLFIIQGLLLSNVASMDAGNQPNMILYGIETDQKEGLEQITEDNDMPVIQQVPIVTMRLAGWKGRSKAEWMADTTRTASRWAINREARVSYRDTLASDEELIKGEWQGYINPGDSIFISLDERYANSMDVDLGDEMVWNVQGTMLTTYVSSIRKIEFRSMRTRFFILFPSGVLENA
ncbi:MAG: FtsX-like permease family protein, partial [Saprospiraceae bacterium]|nr:FtsX-like permease family protein [Saprospiraceae bacterium]